MMREAISTATHTQRLASLDATHQLGRRLGQASQPGQVLALRGDLGAGKTALTQGIAAGLGIAARVTSPTFILINEYDAGDRGLALVHVDTYRLGDAPGEAAREAASFGLAEILATAGLPLGSLTHGAVVVIEWAERVAEMLPTDHLQISLVVDPDDTDARRVTLTAHGPQSQALLAAVTDTRSTGTRSTDTRLMDTRPVA
jgi:tRNA threonylcarbamoyladenosine biosynthesis protein TsaE